VRCPRKIRPKAVVSALKALAEQEEEKLAIPDGIYEQLFLQQIFDNGRISELPLTASYLLLDPKAMLQSMQMGFDLAAKGKISLEVERIRGTEEVRKIIEELGEK
jgi:heterodisulfide reductase subunit C